MCEGGEGSVGVGVGVGVDVDVDVGVWVAMRCKSMCCYRPLFALLRMCQCEDRTPWGWQSCCTQNHASHTGSCKS
jgi:hypothetical protein